MKAKNALVAATLILFSINQPVTATDSRVFVGYELGEMAFNNFKHVAGEIGFKLTNRRAVRLALVNVELTERHLSSNEATVVDGDNVEGSWKGVDIYYDFSMTNQLSIGPSVGYHDTEYRHTVLGDSVRTNSPTVGLAASYGEDSVFGNSDLYWRFSLTSRYFFKTIEDTRLGESVVKKVRIDFIPLIYIGYKF